jgi:hypothetical protein
VIGEEAEDRSEGEEHRDSDSGSVAPVEIGLRTTMRFRPICPTS